MLGGDMKKQTHDLVFFLVFFTRPLPRESVIKLFVLRLCRTKMFFFIQPVSFRCTKKIFRRFRRFPALDRFEKNLDDSHRNSGHAAKIVFIFGPKFFCLDADMKRDIMYSVCLSVSVIAYRLIRWTHVACCLLSRSVLCLRYVVYSVLHDKGPVEEIKRD